MAHAHQSRHLPIREPHAHSTMLTDNAMLGLAPPPPPSATTITGTTPSAENLLSAPTPTKKHPSPGLAPPVSFSTEQSSPTSFPLAPHHPHSWDLETPYSGSNSRFTSIPITPPRVSTQNNTRQPPSAAVGQSSLTPTRECSPSRLTTISALAGSQLSRVALVRHTRSRSTPMGFTGDNDRGQQRSASGLFSAIFSSSTTIATTPTTRSNSTDRYSPHASSLRNSVSSSSLTTEMGTPRPGNKGFFNFAFGGNSNQPTSPSPSSRSSARALSPDHDTCLIDEFAGISFRSLLQSYTIEPQGTPETPEQALKRAPKGRLEDLSNTAGDLLERVYEAYKTRTQALSDVLEERGVEKELLDESRTKSTEYKIQLERLAAEERAAREEQQVRLTAYGARVRELEEELLREKAKVHEYEKRCVMESTRRKRASTASDSGFESDADSLFSIREKDLVVSPVDSLLDAGVDENVAAVHSSSSSRCDSCMKTLHPVSSSASSIASIRNPTPLSRAWGPETSSTSTNTPPSKWGFASALRGTTRQAGVWGGTDAEIVRQENRMLRARVNELESVVDDVLEVVAGRGGV